MGVKKLPKVKDLQAEYAKLLEEKKKTYAEYRRSREEMRELLTAKANVDRLLKMDEEQKKEQEKAQPQNEILCPKGFGGAALNKQSGGENHGRILPSAGRVY